MCRICRICKTGQSSQRLGPWCLWQCFFFFLHLFKIFEKLAPQILASLMLARLPVSFNKASLQPILRTKIERIPLNWIRLTPPKVIAGFEFSAKSTNLAKMIFVTYMDIIDLRSDCLSIRGWDPRVFIRNRTIWAYFVELKKMCI